MAAGLAACPCPCLAGGRVGFIGLAIARARGFRLLLSFSLNTYIHTYIQTAHAHAAIPVLPMRHGGWCTGYSPLRDTS